MPRGVRSGKRRPRLRLPPGLPCDCGRDPTTQPSFFGDEPCPRPRMPEGTVLEELRWAADAEARIAERVDGLVKRAVEAGWSYRAVGLAAGISDVAIAQRAARGWFRKGYPGRRRKRDEPAVAATNGDRP